MGREVDVATNAEAGRLLQAAEVIRRYAGLLRYHPVTGLAAPPGQEVANAIESLRASLERVRTWMPALAAASASSESGDGPVAAEIRAGLQRVQNVSNLLRAAIEVFVRILAAPERAPLDAPYGMGSPRRAHPGAQATWVAERAEALARELAYAAIIRENRVVAAPPAEGHRREP